MNFILNIMGKTRNVFFRKNTLQAEWRTAERTHGWPATEAGEDSTEVPGTAQIFRR